MESSYKYRYPGARAFETSEAELFYGRKNEIKAIFKLIKIERLLVLFSKSGIGKTSLLNAGLSPLLEHHRYYPIYIRFQDIEISPLETLYNNLAEFYKPEKLPYKCEPNLWEYIKACDFTKNDHTHTPVLIFDQFEEFFNHSKDDKNNFIQEIANLVSDMPLDKVEEWLNNIPLGKRTPDQLAWYNPLSIKIVIAIRSDRLSELDEMSHAMPQILSNRFYLKPLNHTQAKEAIRNPATLANKEFATPPFVFRDDAIIDILQNLSNEYNEIESFQLQILCEVIEKKIITKYDNVETKDIVVTPDYLGGRDGIADILHNYYENHIRLLGNETDQLIARKLIEEELIADGRRVGVAESKVKIENELKDKLLSSRLIRVVNTHLGKIYEISHDSLVEPILKSYEKRKVDEEQEKRLILERKKRQKARKRALLGFLIAVIAIGIIFVFYINAVKEQKAAVEKQRAAEQALEEEEKLVTMLELMTEEALEAMKKAENATIEAKAQRKFANQQTRFAFSHRLVVTAIDNLNIDPELSILLAMQAVSITYSFDNTVLAEAEDVLHRAIKASRIRLTLSGHTSGVNSVAFSPHGKTLASGSSDSTIMLWDVATDQSIGQLLTGHIGGVLSVVFSPDGKTLASGSSDNTIILWDIETRQRIGQPLTGHRAGVLSVAFSPDGKTLASGSWDKTIMLWDVEKRRPIGQPLTGHTNYVSGVAFSPDGKTLASGSSDKTIILWDVEKRQPIGQPLTGHWTIVRSVAFSPDGKRLTTASSDGTVKVWDAMSGKELRPLSGHTSGVNSVAFSPDGKRLATACSDKTTKVWDAVSGKMLFPLSGHTSGVNSVAFSPDGKRLATACSDSTVKVWDAAPSQELLTLQELFTLPRHKGGVNSVAFNSDGKYLVTTGPDGAVKVWDAISGNELFTLFGHRRGVNSAVFSPDGKRLASGSSDNTIILWYVQTRLPIGQPLTGHTDVVSGVAFSPPDGKRLATASSDRTAKVWDAMSGKMLLTLFGHADWVNSVAFSPDGKRLATASSDRTAKVWNAMSGKMLLTLFGHADWVNSVAFSPPNGKRLATASSDRTAKVWDAGSGKMLLTLSGHTSGVNSVAFSSDGTRLATASSDRTAKVWDAMSGKELFTLSGYTSGINGVAFSSDGKHLTIASQDGNVRVLSILNIRALMELAKSRVTRSLTPEECKKYLHMDQCPQTSKVH